MVKLNKLKVEFLNDYQDQSSFFDKNSYMLAPYNSKSQNFDWRMSLKAGDVIDCEDHYGGWYSSTIVEILEADQGKKLAKVTFKIYDEKGNKLDEKGRYFGLAGYN